jgi:Carboxypeptidase regulatory-like domain
MTGAERPESLDQIRRHRAGVLENMFASMWVRHRFAGTAGATLAMTVLASMSYLSLECLGAQQDAPAKASQEPTGQISGHVYRSDGGPGIAKAIVSVMALKDNLIVPVESVESGPDGAFHFAHLPSGVFLIRAEKDGFVSQNYGAETERDAADTIKLVNGQILDGVDFRLRASGVIAGHVMDENGSPVQGLRANAIRVEVGALGGAAIVQGSTTTDDLGDFRILGLPPGRYYVGIGSVVGVEGKHETYPQVFYPGTASFSAAERIGVPSGTPNRLTFSVTEEKAYRITGKIIGLPGDDSGGYVAQLKPDSEDAAGTLPIWTSGPSDIHADESFVIQGVPGGRYILEVARRTMSSSSGTMPLSVAYTGTASVTVANEDVIAQIVMEPPAEVRGTIESEKREVISTDAVRLNLAPLQLFGHLVQLKIGSDRHFVFKNVAPGRYVFSAFDPRRTDIYVKEADCTASVQPVPQLLTVESGSVADCKLVLANDVGVLSGAVQDGEKTIPNVLVIAIPDKRQYREIAGYARETSTDDSGRYELPGLIPGVEYEVFALPQDEEEEYSYFAVDFVERNASTAEHVYIEPHDRKQLNLKLTSPR